MLVVETFTDSLKLKSAVSEYLIYFWLVHLHKNSASKYDSCTDIMNWIERRLRDGVGQ